MKGLDRTVLAAFGLFVVLAFGLTALYALLVNNYDVVDKGRLLPYTSAEIYRIELFGRFTVYAQPENKTSRDIFHSWILVSISSVALLALLFLLTTRLAARKRTIMFFLVTWLGAGFLAIDEVLGVHENLGHNLRFLRELPGIERPDDAVIAFYIVPTAIFLWVFRQLILASRLARIFFVIGAVTFVVAALADIVDLGQGEEIVEATASLWILVGFMILAVDELRRTV